MALFCFLTMFAFMAHAILSATLKMNYPEANSVYKIGDTMLIEWHSKQVIYNSKPFPLGQLAYRFD